MKKYVLNGSVYMKLTTRQNVSMMTEVRIAVTSGAGGLLTREDTKTLLDSWMYSILELGGRHMSKFIETYREDLCILLYMSYTLWTFLNNFNLK